MSATTIPHTYVDGEIFEHTDANTIVEAINEHAVEIEEIKSSGGGGGASDVSDLTASGFSSGEYPMWDGVEFVPSTPSGGGGSYTLPTASTTVKGGVKIDGTSITIDGGGVIHSTGGRIEAKTVYPKDFATGGLGTLASPFTGWNSAIPQNSTADKTIYDFENYCYATATTVSFNYCLRESAVENIQRLTYTGASAVPVVKWFPQGAPVDAEMASGCRMRNVVIDGGAHGSVGLVISRFHRGYIDNVRVVNCPNAASFGWLVTTGINLFTASGNIEPNSLQPCVNGMIWEPDALNGERSSNCLMTNVTVDRHTGIGLWFKNCQSMTVLGGTGEGGNIGVQVDGSCNQITMQGMDNEANTSYDYLIAGSYCVIDGLSSKAGANGETRITGGQGNRILGRFARLVIDNSAEMTSVSDAYVGLEGGLIIDNSSSTRYSNVYDAANNRYINNTNSPTKQNTTDRHNSTPAPGVVIFDTEYEKLFLKVSAGWEMITSVTESISPVIPTLGLVGRWKASVGVTQSSGAVSAWTDQSAASNNLSATGTAKPIYSASGGPNAKAYVSFDGVDDFMSTVLNMSASADVTIFAVMKNNVATTVGGVIAELTTNFGTAPGGLYDAMNDGTANTLTCAHSDGSQYSVVSAAPTPASTWFKARMQHYKSLTTGEAYCLVTGASNSVLANDNVGGTFPTTATLYVGARAGITRFLTGDIAELIIYNRKTTSGDNASVDAYINSEYGL